LDFWFHICVFSFSIFICNSITAVYVVSNSFLCLVENFCTDCFKFICFDEVSYFVNVIFSFVITKVPFMPAFVKIMWLYVGVFSILYIIISLLNCFIFSSFPLL
jgi:hypothetical protein